MCGIIGAAFPGQSVAPLLLDALRCMEYRGYDSAGVALLTGRGGIESRKAQGKLEALAARMRAHPVAGSCGIGHTRWATHGAPSERNAHPHLAGDWAIVHNGIVENHEVLRRELVGGGARFRSETDSETIAHLLAALDQGDPEAAWRAMVARLEGAFAIVALHRRRPDTLWFARRGSPLLLARGADGVEAASDALSVAASCDEALYLEEGDHGWITPDGCALFDGDGKRVECAWRPLPHARARADKGGFDHYMDKEIHEQPQVLDRIVARTVRGEAELRFPHAPWLLDDPLPERIVIVACGTSHHAALAARYWLEGFLQVPVEVDVASEYRYRNPIIGPGTLLVTLSQSGETADTLEAMRLFKRRTPENRTLTLCNVEHSSMVREADGAILLHAGAEIGVASTKAFTAQLASLALFSLALARRAGRLDEAWVREHVAALRRCGRQIEAILARRDEVAALTPLFLHARGALFLGRGACYPLALEGALKLKEISYLHAEGYAAGEMKHGPIALVDETMPVVVLGLRRYHLEKVISNLREVQARGARVVLITDEAEPERGAAEVDARIEIPQGDLFTAPILAAVPLQLLAYHVARAKGTDIDQPRNLAKSVTVE